MEDQGEVQAMPGRQAGSHIFHNGNGFYYLIRERRGNRCRLKCRRYRSCCGTAVVDLMTGILTHLQPHTCQRDHLLPEELAFRRDLIQRASQNVYGAGVRNILREAKVFCDNPDLARRFTTVRMQSAMYTAQSNNYPKIPETISYLGVLLGLPNMRPLCLTVDRQDYIFQGLCGTIQNKSVSLVFASGRMLTFLQSRRNLHLDGTFKKRPKKPKCGQIFNVVTNYDSTVIAILRVLMRRRTEEAYTALFNYLRTIAPDLRPTRIHCDFERATINALRQLFPDCPIVGCLWHYAVACSSKARKLGLSELAADNDLVFSFIKCLCAAPLLPTGLIEPGVEEIWREVQASGWADELEPLFDYFRGQWLPRAAELSVFGHPERTNNCSESDNHMMANILPQNRPNIWRIVGGFVQAEHLSWCDKLAIDAGETVNGRRRWKTIANDNCVLRESNRLIRNIITPGQFLHSASYAILAAVHNGLRVNNEESDSESDDDSD
ncbi:Elongation factor 4 [Frankliniella fusca]|uniref:Elongation factor 4 n=1 Tax=Frankliniella fusca TaxID=407009 RepID=A0AAE1GVM5_9NEOP|nr:Elongation factor 4 [Frankliniella fusca]KAK3910864.1 Elongation factor 4 [Frankliniella fusca]KAK3924566.1 Elongation factor 4 [Frankliniella fusca]